MEFHEQNVAPEILVPARANRLRVIETDPQQDPRWEPFVAAHANGSVYHHPGWLKALRDEYGQRGLHLACEDSEGRLLAVLPMFYTRGLPFNIGGHATKRRLSSLPRTPIGGPLSIHPEATAALLQAAVESVRLERRAQLQLKTEGTQLDGLVDGVVRGAWRSSYLLQLPPEPEQLRFGNSEARHRIKWAVSKALKLGVRVRAAENVNDLEAWYALYLDAMRRNAVPPRPYRFFRLLWDELHPKKVLRLLLAERDEGGRPKMLAGSIILTYARRACYAFTGAKRHDLCLHPNDLIQWQAIHEACRAGVRVYDFGEVPEEHQQLVNFKAKWGARAIPLYRYYYPPGPTSKTLSPTAHRIATILWRRLPLATTALLGDWVYNRL